MSDFDAGRSRATWELDTSKGDRSIADLSQRLLDLEKLQQRVFAPRAQVATPTSANNAALAQQKLATETQKTAAATSQAAKAAQALSTEQNRTAKEAANASAAQDRAAKSALSLAAAQQRAAQQGQNGGLGPALPRTFAGFTPQGFNQAAGAFGLATLGPQIIGSAISGGVDATNAALQLRETKNSLRAVSGDLNTYNQTLQAARDQQRLFGGTLQENIEGLSGLTITARSSGASLQTLIGLSQRLAVLDPAQGAGGARIALNEALSGDPTSLAKRYEIPRAALQKLRDTTLPVEERLKVIDSFLNKVGITAESVAGKVDQDALAFRRVGAELEQTKLNIGDQLATTFSGAATGLARLLGLINENPQAVAELRAILGGKGGVDQTDLNDASRIIAQRQAQRDLRLGQSQGQGLQSERQVAVQVGGQEALHIIVEQLTELKIVGGAAAEQADVLTRAFNAGTISGTTYSNALSVLLQEQKEGGSAEDRRAATMASLKAKIDQTTAAFEAQSKEIDDAANKSALDAAAKEAQQAQTALVAARTKDATDAFIRMNPQLDQAGVLSLLAAGKLDPLLGQLLLLKFRAEEARAALTGEKLQNQTARQLTGADSDEAEIRAGKRAGIVAGRARGQAQAQAAAQAERDAQAAQGNFQPAINRAQADLNQLAKDGKANTAEGIEKQQELNALLEQQTKASRSAVNDQIQYAQATGDTAKQRKLLNDQLAAARKAGDLGEQARILNEISALDKAGAREAKAHTSELNKQLSLEERIRDSKEAQLKASLDAAEAAIKDRQDRRKEDQEIRAAQRILGSGRASQQFKDAAADKIALINIERQQRALDIAQKTATAGGTIVNGRILQSIQGGGVPTPVPAGAVPTPIGQPVAQTPIGPVPMPPVTVNVYLDNEQIAAKQTQILHGDLRRTQSAGVG